MPLPYQAVICLISYSQHTKQALLRPVATGCGSGCHPSRERCCPSTQQPHPGGDKPAHHPPGGGGIRRQGNGQVAPSHTALPGDQVSRQSRMWDGHYLSFTSSWVLKGRWRGKRQAATGGITPHPAPRHERDNLKESAIFRNNPVFLLKCNSTFTTCMSISVAWASNASDVL